MPGPHSDKWKRCVAKVERENPNVNAYAVCTMTVGAEADGMVLADLVDEPERFAAKLKRVLEDHPIGMAEAQLLKCEKADPPDRILLFKDGETGIVGDDGEEYVFDQAQARSIMAHFAKHGNEVPIDYHHTSEEKGVKAIAAGWVKSLDYEDGKGLWADVEWTEQAAAEIMSKQYKYFSPAFLYNTDDNRILVLTSVALTNTPRTQNQTELLRQVAAERGRRIMPKKKKECRRVYVSGAWPDEHQKAILRKCEELIPDVDIAVEALPDEQIEQLDAVGALIDELAPLVGKEAGTGAEEVLAAVIEKLKAGSDEPTEAETVAAELSKTLGVKVGKLVAEVNKMKGTADGAGELGKQVEKLQAELKVLTDEREEQRVEALVAEQVKAGKINPNSEDGMKAARAMATLNGEQFTAMFDAMPVIMPDPDEKVDAPQTRRESKIKAFAAEFKDSREKGLVQCSEAGFINTSLNLEGMTPLTDSEKKALSA